MGPTYGTTGSTSHMPLENVMCTIEYTAMLSLVAIHTLVLDSITIADGCRAANAAAAAGVVGRYTEGAAPEGNPLFTAPNVANP